MDSLDVRRERVREEKQEFCGDVDRILAMMRAYALTLEPAVGEITRTEALLSLRRITVAAFERSIERRS
jgi:hypothetical protein